DIDQLGKTEIVKHKINTGNVSSIKQHPYRISLKYKKFIKEELKRLLQQGHIKVSYSPWISPALVVGKANRKFRLVIDYCQLNKVTKPDTYLLPRIANMIDALAHKSQPSAAKEEISTLLTKIANEKRNFSNQDYTTGKIENNNSNLVQKTNTSSSDSKLSELVGETVTADTQKNKKRKNKKGTHENDIVMTEATTSEQGSSSH
ncbi:11182_t:CDS:2, partial [Scutellospora calospora]